MLDTNEPFAFGTWRFSSKTYDRMAECLSACKLHGITHIDTADVYGGEEGFGTVESLLGRLRDDAPALFEGTTLATKIGIEFGSPYNQDKAYLAGAMRASLDRLRMDKVDLVYIHRPDNLVHPADLAAVLDGFVAEGLAAKVAISNFTPWQVAALRPYLENDLYAHQTEFSILHPERIFDGTLDEAMAHRTCVAAWSPLGGGAIFSQERGLPERVMRVKEALAEIASAHEVRIEDIAYAFVRQHPAGAVPIIGTTRPERLRELLAVPPVTLARPEWYRLLEASLGHKMP